MSSLQDPFQIVGAPSGKVGALIKWRVTEKAKQFVRDNHFDYMVLDASEPGGMDDLGFLVENREKIRHIMIMNDQIDWEVLNQLTSLRKMYIGGWFDCRGLEFRRLENLTHLESYWNKGYEDSLCDLPKLKELKLIGFKSESLETLGALPSLKSLSIVLSRHLTSFRGLQGSTELEKLFIESCSNLINISALSACNDMGDIHLAKCKRLADVSVIGQLVKLRQLVLTGKFPDLLWIENLKELTEIRFDCDLENGNIDFLYHLPNLQDWAFRNKKNYSVKAKDFEKHLKPKPREICEQLSA